MRLAKANPGTVTAGSTLTVSKAIHDGKTILLDQAAGSIITLHAALGTGGRYRIFERVATTSVGHVIKVQNATDVMVGNMVVVGTAANAFATAATSDTITMNRTTSGGAVAGGWVELEDFRPGFWLVRGVLNGSGTPTTPFSATVS